VVEFGPDQQEHPQDRRMRRHDGTQARQVYKGAPWKGCCMFDAAKNSPLPTIRDWLRFAVSRFNEAGLHFGHGSVDAYDEAAYLILHSLHLPLDRLDPFLDARLLPEEVGAPGRHPGTARHGSGARRPT
jgi:hypothetical protein